MRRGRTYLRKPADGLGLLDVDAGSVEDVVVTHMHYDHAGTVSDFPQARLHLQEQELRWVTSSEMFDRGARGSFEVDDVVNMVRGLYDERVQLHDGDWEIAPGDQRAPDWRPHAGHSGRARQHAARRRGPGV